MAAVMLQAVRPAGVPGAYGDTQQIKKIFTNGAEDTEIAPAPASTLRLEPHPVWSTLSAEKFTEGMEPSMASVYPGQNGAAGVAGDFDKIYLPRPLVRTVVSGRPLMKGETQAKSLTQVNDSFHSTISAMPTFAEGPYPYMVPKYAPDFPLETNMDPQRIHSGFMAAPPSAHANMPTSPLVGMLEPENFPLDSPSRKLGGSGSFSDAPFHSTFMSEAQQLMGNKGHLVKTHAAGAKQGKNFTDKLW
ncbi:hypothetical protein T492DRAFT_926794 [Pavlovales sp. CCMP2436]|nr:hypothetical protein T492DRAFT_926794 [Pavlovales sp. CCMP2436]